MSQLISEADALAALPDSEDFSRVLGSITAVKPPDTSEFEDTECAPESIANVPEYSYAEIRLYAVRSGRVGLRWIRAAIARVLEKVEHPAANTAAGMLLGLFVLRRDRSRRPTEALRHMLLQVCECHLNQYLVVPVPADADREGRIGSYRIGPTPIERLRYQCETAGSDYFVRYEQRLRGRLCFFRDPRKIHLLPMSNLKRLDVFAGTPDERLFAQSILERFFSAVSAWAFEEGQNELRESQFAYVGVGGDYFDPRLLARLDAVSSQVYVFLKLGGTGWVAGQARAPGLSIGSGLFSHQGELPQGIEGPIGAGVFGDRLRFFGSMLARAIEHELDRRRDEAFLHRVIALDAVLSDRDKVTDSVTSRAAVLLPTDFGKDVSERRTLVSQIYDTRSDYVHAGLPCNERHAQQLKDLCPWIGRALLRISQLPQDKQFPDPKQWHSMLDAAFLMGKNGIPLGVGQSERLGVPWPGP